MSRSYLSPNDVVYIRNRFFGKHIGNQRPPMFRFKAIRLREEGFVRVEDPIKLIILVPFVPGIVYFTECCWLCKVELRRGFGCEYLMSLDFQTRRVTHLIRGDPYNVT